MNTEPQAVAGIFRGAFDESALRGRIEEARARLPGGRADLALVFVTPALLESASDIIEVVQVHGRATLLAGCTGSGVISNAEEIEDGPATAFILINFPGAGLTATHISATDLETPRQAGWWHARTGLDRGKCRGWLVFADPFSLDAEAWLDQWNDAYPGIATVGGLAGGAAGESQSHLFLNQEVHSEGAVVVGFSGGVELLPLVSQGCRPIGKPWTVTAAERNLIHRIGNLPALTVLQETFEELPASDKARASGNIFVGLAVNEYQEEHRRGDFLVRNLLAADPQSGVVAVGARVRVGQTIQFQFRDGVTAAEDLSELLVSARDQLGGRSIVAMCLCSCSGRGAGLFGHPHHDARQLHDGLGSHVPLAGFFCNGEIGPVGGRISLHGYTASAAILVSDASA